MDIDTDVDIEIFQGKYIDYTVEFRGRTVSPQVTTVSGSAVRTIEKKRVGFHYANMPCDQKTQVKKALQSARISDMQYQWDITFPGPQKYPPVKGICDSHIENADITDVVEYCLTIVEGLENYGISSKGVLCCKRSQFTLHTSTSLDVEEKSTYFTLDMDVTTRETAVNVVKSCRLWDKNSEILVNTIREHCSWYNTKKKEFSNRFAFGSRALYAVLRPLVWQISIDRVKRGISKVKAAHCIAGELFTLVDDGLYPNGVGTSLCDGEGIPSTKYSIIEKGVVTHFMYDHFRALLDKTKSTGNAVRTSMMAPPKIAPRNLVVHEGDYALDEFTGILIEEVVNDKGANLVSGEYTFNVKRAFYVKKGEILGVVAPFVLQGNTFDVLKYIYGVGTLEETPFPRYRELVTPYIFIQIPS
ncbi:MAG: TldD/PmbA family protein [Theionarchaea archaeon]|nr:MAG: hypothetical protein AYK19_17465 [Theionarchaea archaeon DG-70-1]MBU7026760.1 TldD/PmbA family protein [Theionarchaea archaeon]